MTFEAPWLLLALIATPLPWVFGRIRCRRIRVEVPSLLLWDRVAAAAGPPAARERRRIVDARTLVEIAALVALALAAAGPRLGAPRPPRRVAIVVDGTPSMLPRRAAAEAAVRDLTSRLDPADEVVRSDDLLEAKAAGVDAVYFFTDHDPPSPPWEGEPRLVVALVPGGGPNAGIVGAGGRVAAGGALEIAARVASYGIEPPPAAAPARVAPAPAGPVEVRIDARDALAADDVAMLIPPGAPPAVTVDGAVPADVRRALLAAGATLVEQGGRVRVAVEPARAADRGTGPRIAIAPEPGRGPPPERLAVLATPLSRHADMGAQRLRMAPADPPPDLRPVVIDERGRPAIGYREERGGTLIWIGIPLALGEAATDWAGDRSFPIFFAEALAALGAGAAPGDLWRGAGVLSEAETREAALAAVRPLPPGEPRPAPADPGAAAGPRGLRPAPREALLAPAAGLIVAAFALARERRLPAREGGPS